jgi:plasmid stabilization system protein ParE
VKYRVTVYAKVHEQIEQQVTYLLSQSAPYDRVSAWLDSILSAMRSLSEHPQRFPVYTTPDDQMLFPVRRMNVGDYAVFFHVNESAGTVTVLEFRHGRQAPFKP